MLTTGVILILTCLVACAVWGAVWVNAARNDRMLPAVAEGLERAGGAPLPKLSVVLPMHNEAHDAPGCIETLRAQDYAELEIVLSLDRCTDETPAIARDAAAVDPRLRVVETEPIDGWWGKCVPMEEGAEAAGGAWLVFIDADTRLDPTLLRAAMGLALDRGWDMIGVLPRLTTGAAFERVVQPVATMQMMYMFQPQKINREADRRPFGLGPFMMLSRRAYDAAGLMASVKDDIQEDVAVARAVHAAGYRVGLASGDGLFDCRMFTRFHEFYHGWKRIFTRMSGNRVGRLRKYALRLLGMGVLLPAAQLAAVTMGIVSLATGATMLGTALILAGGAAFGVELGAIGRIYRRGGAGPLSRAAFPLGFAAVAWLLNDAASHLKAGRPVRWAGRDYVLTPRKGRRNAGPRTGGAGAR